MGKIILILLLFASGLCYGQGYKVCKVYYINSSDSTGNGLEKKQVFNNYGKITFERTYGSHYNSSNRSYNDTLLYNEEKYFHYIKDTLLSSSIELSYDDEYSNDRLTDTTLEYYRYNPKNQLTSKRYVSFRNQLHGSCLPDPDKSWGDTIINYYQYDKKGNLILDSLAWSLNPTNTYDVFRDSIRQSLDSIRHAERKTKHTAYATRFTYDDSNRLLTEVSVDDWGEFRKEEYKYTPSGYRSILTGTHYDVDTTNVTYRYDKQNRIIEESTAYTNVTKSKKYGYFPDKRIVEEITVYKPRMSTYDFEYRKAYSITHLYTYE